MYISIVWSETTGMDHNIDHSFQADLYDEMWECSGSYLIMQNCSDSQPLTDPVLRSQV